MAASYKPNGYTSVAPYLIVNGAGRTIDFLQRVFDAAEVQRMLRPDGSVMHAEVRIDDTVLMLSDAGSNWPAIASNVHIYVPDVDATYRRAIELGALSLQEPTKKDDQDKRGGVKDAGGTNWWIATKVE
jgi:uncharacterized glyoxalase superfamily protein PhnB